MNRRCDVKTVVEISKERREFVRERYPDIRVVENVTELVDDESIDAVVVSTPAKTHFELAKQILEAGKHVLVEKPMARNCEEIYALSKLSKEKRRVAMAGFTFLFNPAVRLIKKLIDDNELGQLRYLYSERVNLGRIRSDVDALWNLAPHDISIIQYWLGDLEPVAVHRHGMSYVQQGIDDVVFLNITYPKGIMANIHVSWLDPQKIRRITVVGSRKMVVYDDIAKKKVAIYDKGIDRMAVLGKEMFFDSQEVVSFNHRSGEVEYPTISWEEPLSLELDHFMDCVLDGIECVSGTEQATKVLEVLSRCG
jgi:predicted dehydrogenase